jgi:ankyrin repeat protein
MTASLFEAARTGDIGTLDRLLAGDASLAMARDAQGISLLLNAYYHGRPEAAERILAAEPTLDVFEAATAGDAERLAELLDGDRTLVEAWSVDGYQPLMLASFFGRLEAARVLLERGASPSEASRNAMAVMPLHSAAAGRHVEVAMLLIARGAQVDARSHGGFTPLHSAAQNGDLELVRVLLAAGAGRAPISDKGLTPADMADQAGHAEAAALLRA